MPELIPEILDNLARLQAVCPLPTPEPNERARLIVDKLREGIIHFYGTREVQVGTGGIDWSGSHVKHQEWPAQLNRFFWLAPAMTVYQADRDESIAALARDIIDDWIATHDYGRDKPLARGDNTLNTSIRLGQGVRHGWWGVWQGFADSDAWDEAFAARMLESTRGQLDYLATHLAPASNWRISHVDCILFVSQIAPGLEAYRDFAVRELNEAFWRQVHADGSHEEHNPNSYHGWMTNTFTRLWRLQRGMPELGLRIDAERVAGMWDYLVHATTPDGGSAGLHDAPPWKAGGPGGIKALDDRAKLLDEAGLADEPARDIEQQPCAWFDKAGQLFLRDGWTPTSSHWVFDATMWGGGHCHLSRLSVNVFAGGRALLCDPGSFTYETSDPFAVHCKATPTHNTVNIDGMSQTEADPRVDHVYVDNDLALINADYQGGYFPGDYTWGWPEGKGEGTYGRHQRLFVWLRGCGALVFDLIQADAGHDYAAHWQFPEGPAEVDAAGRRAWTRSGDAGAGQVLLQVIEAPDDVALTLHEGERDPIRGWAARQVGDYHPAPQLAVAGRLEEKHVTLTTLIVPFVGDQPPRVDIETLGDCGVGARGWRISWPNGRVHEIAWTSGLHKQVERAGPITTDAAAAVVELEGDRVVDGAIIAGMRLERDGAAVIDEPRHGDYRRNGR